MNSKIIFGIIKSKYHKLLPFSIACFFFSCTNNFRTVYKTKVEGYKARFCVSKTDRDYKKIDHLFAYVDSSGIRIHYNFFTYRTEKQYGNKYNPRYTLIFNKNPISGLTEIDSLILLRADQLMDSMGYENLKRTAGATGYNIEVIRTP